MNKINWKQKLSSRKFWALVAALVLSAGAVFGAGEEVLTRIAGLVTTLGAVVAYILAEASIDRAREENTDGYN